MFKLTDKHGKDHYLTTVKSDTEKRTVETIVRAIKTDEVYHRWAEVYEDVLFREKAYIKIDEIYLVQEIPEVTDMEGDV